MPDRESLPEPWQRGFAWVEQQLGGTLTRWEPQTRWRPAWFLELERGDETLSLYWRGARAEFHRDTGPLAREGRVLEVLERNGIPVPHPYGVCEDPPGLLLGRLPGTFNLGTEPDAALRQETLDHYLEILVAMHGIDPREFADAGMRMPKDGVESCLGDLPGFEREYRRAKQRPDPMIEFAVDWCRRNVPRDRPRVTFVHCDSGQFLFEGGRVTGLIDFEISYLGDPAADLAGMRSRQLSEPLGDMRSVVQRYGELSGEPVDTRAVDYHTVRFGLSNPLGLANVLAKPVSAMNYVQYLAWYVVYSRCPLEVMAHMLGVELEAPALPEPAPSFSHTAATHLVEVLGAQRETGSEEDAYDSDRLYRVAQYLERSDQYRPALESDDLDEATVLLGHRPASRPEADAALERLVLERNTEGALDAELLRFFHRRLCREESLLEPTLRELTGARIEPID
jgi:aminoglycoside phosphotransferase (APT) family kinase protein